MDAPVATYLPQLAGSPAGAATMHELVTHTSGYAEFGAATLRRAAWAAPLGRNFLDADTTLMLEETGTRRWGVPAGTHTPPWARPSPVKPSPRPPA